MDTIKCQGLTIQGKVQAGWSGWRLVLGVIFDRIAAGVNGKVYEMVRHAKIYVWRC